MQTVKIIRKPKPCRDWESWYQAITLSGLILAYQRDKGIITSITTRRIDNENVLEVARQLAIEAKNLAEMNAALRNLGGIIEQEQPGPAFRAKFSRDNFRPCIHN